MTHSASAVTPVRQRAAVAVRDFWPTDFHAGDRAGVLAWLDDPDAVAVDGDPDAAPFAVECWCRRAAGVAHRNGLRSATDRAIWWPVESAAWAGWVVARMYHGDPTREA